MRCWRGPQTRPGLGETGRRAEEAEGRELGGKGGVWKGLLVRLQCLDGAPLRQRTKEPAATPQLPKRVRGKCRLWGGLEVTSDTSNLGGDPKSCLCEGHPKQLRDKKRNAGATAN